MRGKLELYLMIAIGILHTTAIWMQKYVILDLLHCIYHKNIRILHIRIFAYRIFVYWCIRVYIFVYSCIGVYTFVYSRAKTHVFVYSLKMNTHITTGVLQYHLLCIRV